MPAKSPTEQHILQIIDEMHADQVQFLAELVRSPSDNPPGDCAPHARRAAVLLESMGFTVERHDVPTAVVEANGMRSVTNLVVRHRFGPGPTIALNAHGDVVAPGAGWTHDPYGAEIADGGDAVGGDADVAGTARAAGAAQLPPPVQALMRAAAKVMTTVAQRV